MPLPCHFTMKGEKQGKIEGSCEMEGREGSIIGYWLTHQVEMPHSPTDGFPTEKRGHCPLKIIKEHDKSSPKLHQALCTGEHMKYVDIKWYRINKLGHEEHYFTHTLEDATITSIGSFMPITFLPEYESFPFMEKVAFSYRNIRWTWEPHGIEAEDKHVTMKKRPVPGDNMWKDLQFATLAAGWIAWETTKMGVEKTVDTGIDAAKAALLEFLEVPWIVQKLYDASETAAKIQGIQEDVTHKYREKGEYFDRGIRKAMKRVY
jgi:type VI secretion system secreted protein Hcp